MLLIWTCNVWVSKGGSQLLALPLSLLLPLEVLAKG
jgi:hypothetical protein